MNIKVHLDGDGCWPDLKEFLHGEVVEAAYLEHGMQGGDPSVTLRITLDSGTIVLAETSVKLFMTVAAAFSGKAAHEGIDCWRAPEMKS